MSPRATLREAVVVRQSAKAYLVDLAVNTDRAGVQTCQVWLPKSHAAVAPDGQVEVADWLLQPKEEEIAREHPDWGCVGIRLAEDPNQIDMWGDDGYA